MTLTNPSPSFWAGKRVLLTGDTGFKGAWLALWLHRLGAQVTGLSRAPVTEPSLYGLADLAALMPSHRLDLRDATALADLVRQAQPEIVFHLAAQALVRAGYRDPLGTWATNTLGTAHLLDALRPVSALRVVVAITTDKVYQNLEQPLPYRETDALGGHDPYSASKAAAELVIASYRDAFLADQGVAVASTRAGNVIGGGDWADDRLLPDAVRAWQQGQPLQVRRPEAIRPWQHVLEPLNAYLQLAEQLWASPERAGAYNFGPHTHEAASVRQVIERAQVLYGCGEVIWGDGHDGPHEAGWLALEIAKARHQLGLAPRWPLATGLARTLDWYRRQTAGEAVRALCEADIAAFEATTAAA
ncbi:CDP-glucose 4,6-dehydratase [Lamprobacter modestohalophilus]|uniref:CDP-glucose 4,6-dehydratase n=1 Tax=Lamprobacter modestohalophilus TaxID=1064514 RepID=UPI002ADEF981|nr:CDP-glucose 4,6-dehydratase [Lamprobacter modestohalophilus]MEA1051629.1 CDP-glucose 4,6-dehydratase [Lamprobacter modestohalophilus]